MKKVYLALTLAAFTSAVFYACSTEKPNCERNPELDYCSDEGGWDEDSSSSDEEPCWDCGEQGDSSSDTGNNDKSSSSNGASSPSGSSSSGTNVLSSSSVSVSSSSSAPPPIPGAGCDYKPQEFCKGITFSDIITENIKGELGGWNSSVKPENVTSEPKGPYCVFATSVSMMGNENGNGSILINGIELKGLNNSDVAGRCGNQSWNQKSCSQAMTDANVKKVDGGYYIYVADWAGDFDTKGGTPDCGNTPDASTFTCTGLANTGIANSAITQPAVRCDGVALAATAFSWTGSPASWTAPTAGTYNISATATSGSCSGKTATCGSIVVSAPAATDLTCVGMPQTGTVGTAITAPTVRCGTNTLTTGLTWTNAPTWNSPAANTYNVSVSASCGGSNKTASCGSLTVSPKLECSNITTTAVTEGSSFTRPTVRCGTTAVTTNLSWKNAPDDWSKLAANGGQARIFNSISVSATAGSCKDQSANCSGTLTVNPKLTCTDVYQTITTSQTPTKPTVRCGLTNGTTVSASSWAPTNINGFNSTLAAGTYTNIKATGTCGNSTQTADCNGSITVTAAAASSSSTQSSSSPASSSSVGGGSNPYPPLTSGTGGWASRYWDGCKASCGWSTNVSNGGPTKSCGINGTSAVDNNTQSGCNNGSAYTCFSQAPFVDGAVAYAFAASHTNGDCGKCFQLQFDGTSQHASPSVTLNHIKGKTLIIKISNIGGDVQGNQYDLMIPGGGLGAFDGFSKQGGVNGSVITSSERYGGFITDCINSVGNNGTLAQYQSCLKGKCDAAFTNADLKSGCYVYADWFGVANNPKFISKEISCPSQLNSKW